MQKKLLILLLTVLFIALHHHSKTIGSNQVNYIIDVSLHDTE